jgi:hypothetical protein
VKSKADVVSNIALVVAIILLLSAGAFLLIVIQTAPVPAPHGRTSFPSRLMLQYIPRGVVPCPAGAGLFFSIISLLFEWKARKRNYTSANDADEK